MRTIRSLPRASPQLLCVCSVSSTFVEYVRQYGSTAAWAVHAVVVSGADPHAPSFLLSALHSSFIPPSFLPPSLPPFPGLCSLLRKYEWPPCVWCRERHNRPIANTDRLRPLRNPSVLLDPVCHRPCCRSRGERRLPLALVSFSSPFHPLQRGSASGLNKNHVHTHTHPPLRPPSAADRRSAQQCLWPRSVHPLSSSFPSLEAPFRSLRLATSSSLVRAISRSHKVASCSEVLPQSSLAPASSRSCGMTQNAPRLTTSLQSSSLPTSSSFSMRHSSSLRVSSKRRRCVLRHDVS